MISKKQIREKLLNKKMKVVILQSVYLPWLGYFNMIGDADIFVFLDDVQWTKRDWRNRNRIRTPQSWCWLTVPVKLEKAHYDYRICEVKVDNSQNWQENHLGRLDSFYRNAPYYNEIYPPIKNILDKKHKYMVDINYELIFWISDYLNLKSTKFLFSQTMNVPFELQKTDRLIWILEKIGKVEYYITGPAAKPYLEIDKFNEKKIKVEWHDYKHPYYNQNTWESDIFISYLSVIDLLFNHGKESLQIIINQKIIERSEFIKVIIP